METKPIIAIIMTLCFLLFGAGFIWVWIWCIIDCCKNENNSQNKLIWLLTLFLLTLMGALLYFFIRRPERLKEVDDSLSVNKKAIISLIIGGFGFWILGIGLFTNLIGIVLGHMARKEIKQGISRGNAVALSGLIISYLPYVLLLLIIIIGLPLLMVFGEKA